MPLLQLSIFRTMPNKSNNSVITLIGRYNEKNYLHKYFLTLLSLILAHSDSIRTYYRADGLITFHLNITFKDGNFKCDRYFD